MPETKATLVRRAKIFFSVLISPVEYFGSNRNIPVKIWPLDARVSFVLKLEATARQIFETNHEPSFRKLIWYNNFVHWFGITI